MIVIEASVSLLHGVHISNASVDVSIRYRYWIIIEASDVDSSDNANQHTEDRHDQQEAKVDPSI